MSYIETIETIKKDHGEDMSQWSKATLNRMAFAEMKLHSYANAYMYYVLAGNEEANKALEHIPLTELEENYAEHISQDVRIISFKGRRGVLAKRDLPMGHVVCEIPLYLCTTGTKEELTKYISTSNIYSRSLPEHDTFPVTWDVSTCDQIAVSPLRIALEEKIHMLKKEDIGIPKYLYLRSLVGSRCFAHKDKEYMVPFADMLNHSNTPNVDWTFEKHSFKMVTISPVKAHTELFDYYGPKSNYESFLHYGFVQPNNTSLDVIRLVGELPEKVAKHRLDARYFQRAFEFELRGSYMEGTVEIFSFLRYVRSNEKKCPETLKGYFHPPISKENELWVCKMLFNMLQKETHRRVESTAYGITNTLAIALLQSELNVLVHWGEILRLAIHIMEKGDKKALKKSKHDYIVKVIKKYKYY